MNLPTVLLVAAVAFAGGYFARKTTEPERAARADTVAERDPIQIRREVLANLSEDEAEQILRTRYRELYMRRNQPEVIEEEQPEDAQATDNVLKAFQEMAKSMGPQWRAMFAARGTASGVRISKALEMDPATAAKVQAAFKTEGERAADTAISLLTGEFEGTEDEAADAFAWFMSTAAEMSDDMANELATFLSDTEVGAVREQMRLKNKEEMRVQADTVINMMGLPDLSETQTVELRELFSDGGMMKEQTRIWTQVMKDPARLLNAKTDKDWAELFDPAFKPSRDRIQGVLTEKQMTAYKRYEQQMVGVIRTQISPYLKPSK